LITNKDRATYQKHVGIWGDSKPKKEVGVTINATTH